MFFCSHSVVDETCSLFGKIHRLREIERERALYTRYYLTSGAIYVHWTGVPCYFFKYGAISVLLGH